MSERYNTLTEAWQAVDRAITPLGYGGGATNSPWMTAPSAHRRWLRWLPWIIALLVAALLWWAVQIGFIVDEGDVRRACEDPAVLR